MTTLTAMKATVVTMYHLLENLNTTQAKGTSAL